MQKQIKMQKQKKGLILFLSKFIGIIVAYYVFLAVSEGTFVDYYINFTAYISSMILSIFVSGAHSELANIVTPKFVLVLSFGCEGSEPLIIFLAGILSFPSNWQQKLFGLLYGIPLIYFLNIIRILGLYFIGINFSTSFDFFHTILFPILFILLAVLAWLYWLKSITLEKKVINT